MAQMRWGRGALRLLRNGTECLVIISRSRHTDIIPVLQEMFSDTPVNGRNKDGDGCAEREWRRDCHVKTSYWRYDFRFLFMYKYTFCRFGICILKIRKIESVECHSLVRLAEELIREDDLEPSEGLYYSFYSLYRLLLNVRTYSFVS